MNLAEYEATGRTIYRAFAEAVAKNGDPRSLGIQKQRDFDLTNEPNDDVKRLHSAMGELSGDRQAILAMHYLETISKHPIARTRVGRRPTE